MNACLRCLVWGADKLEWSGEWSSWLLLIGSETNEDRAVAVACWVGPGIAILLRRSSLGDGFLVVLRHLIGRVRTNWRIFYVGMVIILSQIWGLNSSTACT